MKEIRESLPHVAVLLECAYVTNRELLKGFLEYTRMEEPWTLTIKTGRADEPGEIDFDAIRCAGIVTDNPDAAILSYARRRRVPVVTVLQDRRVTKDVVADVTCDNASVARLAADHLAGPGLRRFAYVGERSGAAWSQARSEAFHKALIAKGFSSEAYDPAAHGDLGAFLSSLKKPCGVFVANDTRAVDVIRAASESGITIPDELAVVSVDNDEILCETARPAISSIPWDTVETGRTAAKLLAEAILSRKRPAPFRTVFYSGTTVVARRSSAYVRVSDALARRCLGLMELNYASSLSVDDLAKRLFVSRRTLERRFLAATGKSVASALLSLRMAKAASLIRTTDQPLGEIAALCGFCDASHLVKTFKRHAGVKPSSLRGRGR